jgi:hypothetical protein
MNKMDVREYRRRYEAELAAAAAAPEQPVGSAALSAAAATADAAATRHMAQRALLSGGEGSTLGESVPALLATLRNPREPVAIRDAALQALGAAAFLGERFAPYRVEFLDTLRQLETPPELREKALAVLAAEKDPDVQDMLRRGLRDPRSAQVSAAKALQLLSLDDHADIAGLAQEAFQTATDLATKEAALRVLATNANAQDLLANLLGDKSQPRSLRALSATGLHSLNPQRFADIARKIVMDDSDYEDIRATSLGALASAPEHHAVRSHPDFLEQVRQLGAQPQLKNLRAAANRLITNQ